MPNPRVYAWKRHEPTVLVALLLVAIILSGIRPYDRGVWLLEVLPVLVTAPIMIAMQVGFYDDYFIHGTPEIMSIGTAASHGCVRMAKSDAVDLAILIHRYATASVTTAELERLTASDGTDRTQRIAMRLGPIRAQ